MLESLLKSRNTKYEITEDEKGFGVYLHDEVDHNAFNNESLQKCYGNVNESVVLVYNFFMDYFFGKLNLGKN